MDPDDLNISRFTMRPAYDGALPIVPQSPVPPGVNGMDTQPLLPSLMAKNAEAQRDAAAAFEEAAIERNNYTVDQLRQAATLQVQADVSAQMTSRLALPDGSDGAFYSADGSFREDTYKRFRASVLKSLSGLEKGYIGDTAQAKALANQAAIQSKIMAQMDATLAEQMAPRAKAATQRNVKLLAAQGRHAEAAAVIEGCDYLTDAEKELGVFELEQDAALWTAQAATNNGDTAAYIKLISNPAIWNNLTPENQRRILALQHQAQSNGGAIVTHIDPATGKKTVAKTPPELPCGTPRYITSLYEINGGNLSQGDAKQAFSDLLPQLVTDMVSDPNSEEQAQRVLNIVNIADSSQTDFAKRLIKRRQEYLNGSGSFDFKTTWSHMPKDIFFKDDYIAQLKGWMREAHAVNKDGTPTPAAKKAAAHARARREEMDAAISEMESRAWSLYQRWENSLDHKPTPREQAEEYTNITEQLLREAKVKRDLTRHSFFTDIQTDTSQARRNAAAAHSEEFAAAVQLEDQRRLEQMKQRDQAQAQSDAEAVFSTDVDVYSHCDTDRMSTAKLPDSTEKPILYVPKGSPMVGQLVTVHAGKAATQCEVREADVKTTALSTRATWQLGIVAGQDHSQIRFDETGAAHLTPASTIPQQLMGQYIFAAEARFDDNGNLTAHPSEEGKEYAGINQLFDPDEVEIIDQLVKDGNHAQAKRYAIKTYIRKTQHVADNLATIGLRSAPIEYSLRDIAFNMGEGGMKRVIAKATGISNASPYQALATYLRTHDQADLLQALYAARAKQYKAIIDANPKKAKYANGWANRNRAVLNHALELLFM